MFLKVYNSAQLQEYEAAVIADLRYRQRMAAAARIRSRAGQMWESKGGLRATLQTLCRYLHRVCLV